MDNKKCFKCGCLKDSSAFYLDKSRKDNLTSTCKECLKVQQNKYRQENREKCNLSSRNSHIKHKKRWKSENPYKTDGKKKCSKCKIVKNRNSFCRDNNSKDGLLYMCEKCNIEYHKEWCKNNIERHRILSNKRSKKWRIENPQKVIDIKKKYRKDNPEKSREYARKRRALKMNAGGSFTIQEWLFLKKKHNYTCLACFRVEPEICLEPDHIIPLSKGGSDYIDNIQPLCAYCNGVKWNKILTIYELRKLVKLS